MSGINLTINDEDLLRRWQEARKKIKSRGMMVRDLVAEFLIDKLTEDEKNDFKELKKYI